MSQKRIVSLLPSCTEIVCALGCGSHLVGRSHECDYPPEIQALPACTAPRLDAGTGGAGIDAVLLRELRPSLILAQSQPGGCAVSREELEKAFPAPPAPRPEIVSVAPGRLEDVWKDIQTIADAVGVSEEGRALLWRLKNRVVDIIEKTCMMTRRPAVACLEWLDPLTAAGNWLPEMVELAGGRNLFGEPGRPAPRLEWESFASSQPDVIILAPRGCDIARARRESQSLENRPGWGKLHAVKSKNIFVADGGQYFNRPGPRIVDSVEMLSEMLHPKVFSFGHEGRGWARL
jgi:iron complex transport system substrate-binding protein